MSLAAMSDMKKAQTGRGYSHLPACAFLRANGLFVKTKPGKSVPHPGSLLPVLFHFEMPPVCFAFRNVS